MPTCRRHRAPDSRLVVPGFKGRANLEGEIRRDAPAGSRLSQHLAHHSATWNLLSADVKAAFLKGDPFVARELYIGPTNEKTGPAIPLPNGCLAKVLKGVFGLADAPRQWWLKLAKFFSRSGAGCAQPSIRRSGFTGLTRSERP